MTTDEAACHVPASPPKSAEWAEKVLDSWDSVVAMSRASLQRRLAAIARSSIAPAETAPAAAAAMSRATFGP
jgi:hypothetical protein